MQHPFYWYSTPALLKEWQDLVLEHGWAYGFRAYQARRAAQKFRRHDEQSVRELAGLRGDRKGYIGRAREMIRDLERLLQDDLGGTRHELDSAWDTASMRVESGDDD